MNIALIGYGKMGKAIEAIAVKKGHTIVLTIDQPNLSDLTGPNLSKADVAIEFTGPESAFQNIMTCLSFGIPLVSGSTGWTDRMKEVEAACLRQKGCFIYSSNFSIGVNIFFELNKKLASLMAGHEEYDVHLEETHHTQKKDAPSGTSLTLAGQVLESIQWKKQWVNGPGDNPGDLRILSHRIDPAPGTHEVTYSSPIDDIAIIHTAHNRMGFASGAILAAEFIRDKHGIFTMKDVLGF